MTIKIPVVKKILKKMPKIVTKYSSTISASADNIYSILIDYNKAHPEILPSRYFSDFKVLKGGRGEGTVISFNIKLMGNTQQMTAKITEPEPGKVLKEINIENGGETTFFLDEIDDKKTRVTIQTEWSRSGFQGVVEKLLAPPMLRRIYIEELKLLEERFLS